MKIQQITPANFVFAATLCVATFAVSSANAQLNSPRLNTGQVSSAKIVQTKTAQSMQDTEKSGEQSEQMSPSDISSAETVTLRGVLNPIETLRLATRDPGIVKEVLVREGDVVKAGQTIAVLDDEVYAAELSAAKNDLEIAKEETKNDTDLQFAKLSSEVNRQVLDRSRRANVQFKKAVSKIEIERLRLEYERSRLSGVQAQRQQTVNQLNQRLKADQATIAELRLKNRTITSKIDGTVVEVLNTPGEFVNSGQPIARVLNLNRLRVICAGNAKTLDPNNISKEATFKIMVNEKTVSYPAKVIFISPEIDPVRQTFAVWAEIQNTDQQLRAGNVGDLEIRLK